jgi:hypothetical protein
MALKSVQDEQGLPGSRATIIRTASPEPVERLPSNPRTLVAAGRWEFVLAAAAEPAAQEFPCCGWLDLALPVTKERLKVAALPRPYRAADEAVGTMASDALSRSVSRPTQLPMKEPPASREVRRSAPEQLGGMAEQVQPSPGA